MLVKMLLAMSELALLEPAMLDKNLLLVLTPTSKVAFMLVAQSKLPLKLMSVHNNTTEPQLSKKSMKRPSLLNIKIRQYTRKSMKARP